MKKNIEADLLYDILRKKFYKHGIEIRFVDYRAENDQILWEEFLDNFEYVSVKYTWADLHYQFCYMEGFADYILNLSMIFIVNNDVVGCWPLSLSKKEVYHICTNNGKLLAPLFLDNKKTRKAINDSCLGCIYAIFDYLYKNNFEYDNKVLCEHDFNPAMYNRAWFEKQMLLGGRCFAREELYVDLNKTYDEIHKNIRKSYKSLINYGFRNWKIKFCLEVDTALFEKLKDMHFIVAGRKTRSDESWNLQYAAINNGTAFIAVIEDVDRIIGWSLFSLSRDECYYGVGVFDRTMFDKPISHFLQDSVIKYLKANTDIKWYYLGHRFYKGDYYVPTEKELNIAYFKEGFATDKFINLLTETIFEIKS